MKINVKCYTCGKEFETEKPEGATNEFDTMRHFCSTKCAVTALEQGKAVEYTKDVLDLFCEMTTENCGRVQ